MKEIYEKARKVGETMEKLDITKPKSLTKLQSHEDFKEQKMEKIVKKMFSVTKCLSIRQLQSFVKHNKEKEKEKMRTIFF